MSDSTQVWIDIYIYNCLRATGVHHAIGQHDFSNQSLASLFAGTSSVIITDHADQRGVHQPRSVSMMYGYSTGELRTR